MPITVKGMKKDFDENITEDNIYKISGRKWRVIYSGYDASKKNFPWVEIYRLRTGFTEGFPSLVEVEVMKRLAEQKGVELSRDYLFYKRVENDDSIQYAMDNLYYCENLLSRVLQRQVDEVVSFAR